MPRGVNAICLVLVALMLLSTSSPVHAQVGPKRAPTVSLDVHTLPSMETPAGPFDPQRATNAYLARISGKARERSDAYFEGGYVLLFVNAAYAIAVSAFLLFSRISAAMRNYAQQLTRSRFLQAPIYIAQYVVLTSLLMLPLQIYEDFYREHLYGLSNQNFSQWFGDIITGFVVSFVGALVLVTLIYA